MQPTKCSCKTPQYSFVGINGSTCLQKNTEAKQPTSIVLNMRYTRTTKRCSSLPSPKIQWPAKWTELIQKSERCVHDIKVNMVTWLMPTDQWLKVKIDGSELTNSGKMGPGGIYWYGVENRGKQLVLNHYQCSQERLFTFSGPIYFRCSGTIKISEHASQSSRQSWFFHGNERATSKPFEFWWWHNSFPLRKMQNFETIIEYLKGVWEHFRETHQWRQKNVICPLIRPYSF